jgi:hypothetical protein
MQLSHGKQWLSNPNYLLALTQTCLNELSNFARMRQEVAHAGSPRHMLPSPRHERDLAVGVDGYGTVSILQ